ncbi:MAG: hypothetical protein NVSMB42_09060 [Herpetosiphon sp.]
MTAPVVRVDGTDDGGIVTVGGTDDRAAATGSVGRASSEEGFFWGTTGGVADRYWRVDRSVGSAEGEAESGSSGVRVGDVAVSLSTVGTTGATISVGDRSTGGVID